MLKPTPIAYAPNKIPAYLRERAQWVCWKYELTEKGKWTKVPYQSGSGSKAATTRASEWSSFKQAVEALDHYDGIGYCLADGENIVGIDIDHAVTKAADGKFMMDAVVQDIVSTMQSYTELSVSGTGVHVFAFGTKPGDRCRRGSVEMYSRARFLTFTGRKFSSAPATIEARTDQIKAVYQKYLEEPEQFEPRHTAVSAVPHEGRADTEVLDKARGPWKNQAPFLALYNGGDLNGSYSSQSEADLALCGMLAFWAGPHPEQIDRLFRTSKLMRPKWDAKRSGSTYGLDTIEEALAGRTEFYAWPTSDNGHARKSEPSGTEDWPTPSPLPSTLPPVPAFELDLLPAPFRPWVVDIAERAQCPVDFVAVAAVVAAASVLGRQLAIRPKRRDDWTVVSNLWGLVVGRPGVMKSPALQEATRPLDRLVAEARAVFEGQLRSSKFEQAKSKIRRELLQSRLKTAMKDGEKVDALQAEFDAAEDPEPTERRYVVNDSTVEKLGELLNENPNGLLLYRDEVVGWLAMMDREGHEGDRAFYCESWNGTGAYTYDRIGRGTVRIKAACVSVLGGFQPGPLQSHLQEVFGRGATDDGMIQRFQLMVYPDIAPSWRHVDEWPDSDAKTTVSTIFRALSDLDPASLGAHQEPKERKGLPFLRFTPEGQEVFNAWRAKLERRLRAKNTSEHPVIASHLSKYRSLMPSLALLFHVINCVDRGAGGPISAESALQAEAWCTYLEAHARRVYRSLSDGGTTAARALATKIISKEIVGPFRARTVTQRGWAGLTDAHTVESGLDALEELSWIRQQDTPRRRSVGRPTVTYEINPRVSQGGFDGFEGESGGEYALARTPARLTESSSSSSSTQEGIHPQSHPQNPQNLPQRESLSPRVTDSDDSDQKPAALDPDNPVNDLEGPA
jgi:putative DNA primase/helicase